MTPDPSPASELTRRTVLRASAAALSGAGVSGVAGCLGQRTNPGEDTDTWAVGDRLDSVPDDAGSVTYAHVGDLLSDPAVAALLDAYFERQTHSEHYSGPDSLSAARDQFDEESPVALDGLQETVTFNGGMLMAGGRMEMGILLWSDWAESAFVDAVETLRAGLTLTRETYGGEPIYRPESGEDHYGPVYAAGVLGDGQYVLGTEPAVERAIDVAVDDADPLGGAIRGAFSASRPGPYQFAVDVPQDEFEDRTEETKESSGSSEFGPALLAKVNRVYGSLYVADGARGVEVTFDTVDTETAAAIETALGTGIDAARESMESDDPMDRVFEDTTVATDGSRATLRYEDSVQALESLADDLASYDPPSNSESGTSEPRPRPLRVIEAVGADLSDDAVGAVELTVAHAAGVDPVDLAEARLVLTHEDGSDSVFRHPSSDGDDDVDGRFGTPDGTVLDGSDATVRVRVDVGAETPEYDPDPVGDPLPAGSSARTVLIPESGRPTPATLHVPDSLDGEEVELAVRQPE